MTSEENTQNRTVISLHVEYHTVHVLCHLLQIVTVNMTSQLLSLQSRAAWTNNHCVVMCVCVHKDEPVYTHSYALWDLGYIPNKCFPQDQRIMVGLFHDPLQVLIPSWSSGHLCTTRRSVSDRNQDLQLMKHCSTLSNAPNHLIYKVQNCSHASLRNLLIHCSLIQSPVH